MRDVIKSSNNSLIKLIRSLKSKKNRSNHGMFIIEGIRFIEFAVENKIDLVEICYSKDMLFTDGGKNLFNKIKDKKIKSYEIEKKLFDSITDTKNTQGIIAIAKIPEYKIDFNNFTRKFILILDRIQDPGNLGTIIRTADAAGVDCIVISKGTVDPYNEKVLRSTMGSIFSMPIHYEKEILEFINKLKDNEFNILSTCLNTNSYYDEVDYQGKIAIVIGNEANGVSEEIIDISDILVKIPIWGKAESLNASIAAGIIMYEASKNRNINKIK
ncbi:23S rRNA (guanosine(2251)-2'-O)-methyltransferase RlmB [Helicovermis profundi]|uniref:RNA methyltransferase n=1 Tax=Helicovermis profundi TaxID=3065157 RepID=A0AAU9E7I2_9FIRM|nr:RNA methyltransferase [Clostridia bacterium S502]